MELTPNEQYNRFVKFCPECGKELERNIISGWLACFLHGDFEILDGVIVWRYTKNLIPRRV